MQAAHFLLKKQYQTLKEAAMVELEHKYSRFTALRRPLFWIWPKNMPLGAG